MDGAEVAAGRARSPSHLYAEIQDERNFGVVVGRNSLYSAARQHQMQHTPSPTTSPLVSPASSPSPRVSPPISSPRSKTWRRACSSASSNRFLCQIAPLSRYDTSGQSTTTVVDVAVALSSSMKQGLLPYQCCGDPMQESMCHTLNKLPIFKGLDEKVPYTSQVPLLHFGEESRKTTDMGALRRNSPRFPQMPAIYSNGLIDPRKVVASPSQSPSVTPTPSPNSSPRENTHPPPPTARRHMVINTPSTPGQTTVHFKCSETFEGLQCDVPVSSLTTVREFISKIQALLRLKLAHSQPDIVSFAPQISIPGFVIDASDSGSAEFLDSPLLNYIDGDSFLELVSENEFSKSPVPPSSSPLVTHPVIHSPPQSLHHMGFCPPNPPHFDLYSPSLEELTLQPNHSETPSLQSLNMHSAVTPTHIQTTNPIQAHTLPPQTEISLLSCFPRVGECNQMQHRGEHKHRHHQHRDTESVRHASDISEGEHNTGMKEAEESRKRGKESHSDTPETHRDSDSDNSSLEPNYPSPKKPRRLTVFEYSMMDIADTTRKTAPNTSCHRCKTRKPQCLVCPINEKHKFCVVCLERHHNTLVIPNTGCPLCTQACTCAMCRKKLS
ncbi:hypothetical protein Pelo_2435 [Pelomyxa schiedti]|nr:hypothetical protein Pelo_2435 [Pelomyxa schiedti]